MVAISCACWRVVTLLLDMKEILDSLRWFWCCGGLRSAHARAIVRKLRCGKMLRLLTGITDLTVTRTRLTKITCVQYFPLVQFRCCCDVYYGYITGLLLHASPLAIYINSICHGTCKKMLGALLLECWTRRPRTSSTAKRYLCSSSTSFTATTMLLLASFRIGKPSTASTLTALFSSTGLASMNSRRSRDSWWMKMFSI